MSFNFNTILNTSFRFKQFSRNKFSAFNSIGKSITIGVIVSFSFVSNLNAQNSETKAISQFNFEDIHNTDDDEKQKEVELKEVVVSVVGSDEQVNKLSKLIKVIPKEIINLSTSHSIEDILLDIAMIDVQQRGSNGVQADVSIRGGTKDQTAILINGINVSNSHTGVYNLDIPINLSDIEQIEIITGPAALMFGSGAFSGAINIITKKIPNEEYFLSSEIGMHKLCNFEGRASNKFKCVSGSLSVSHKQSDGYIENTDYKIANILFQSRILLKDYQRLDISVGLNDKRYGANDFYTSIYPSQFDHTTRLSSTIRGEFGNELKLIPVVYYLKHFDVFELKRNTNFGKNHHKAQTIGASLSVKVNSTFGNSTVKSEIRHEDILSSVLGKPIENPKGIYKNEDNRTNMSLVFEHSKQSQNLFISGGALLNYNTLETNKLNFLPSIYATYIINQYLSLQGTWSNSVRLPSFTEMWYTTDTHESNKDLKPEYSSIYDIGFRFNKNKFTAYISAFYINGKNIIDWVKKSTDDNKFVYASWNHTQLKTIGLEVGCSINLMKESSIFANGTNIAVDYSYITQTKNAYGEITMFKKNYLRNKFTLKINQNLTNRIKWSFSYRFQERIGYYDLYKNSMFWGETKYKPFSIIDLRTIYKLNDIEFNIDFKNISNIRTSDFGNIEQSGFWAIAGVSIHL